MENVSHSLNDSMSRMFNQQEVQIIVGGVNAPIDLDDLRENCNYGGLYDDNEDTIRMFWKACLVALSCFEQKQLTPPV